MGEHKGDDGIFQLQLTRGDRCCTKSKVVCKCEFETGEYESLYLRCKVCSLQNEPDWSLGFYD